MNTTARTYAFVVVTKYHVRTVKRVRGITREDARRIRDMLNTRAEAGTRWLCRTES